MFLRFSLFDLSPRFVSLSLHDVPLLATVSASVSRCVCYSLCLSVSLNLPLSRLFSSLSVLGSLLPLGLAAPACASVSVCPSASASACMSSHHHRIVSVFLSPLCCRSSAAARGSRAKGRRPRGKGGCVSVVSVLPVSSQEAPHEASLAVSHLFPSSLSLLLLLLLQGGLRSSRDSWRKRLLSLSGLSPSRRRCSGHAPKGILNPECLLLQTQPIPLGSGCCCCFSAAAAEQSSSSCIQSVQQRRST